MRRKTIPDRLNYFRIIYGVTDTDFNYLGINYGVADTDLALLIPSLLIGYRYVIPNYCRNPTRIPRSPFGMSVTRSVIYYGESVTMSAIGGFFWGYKYRPFLFLNQFRLQTQLQIPTEKHLN